MMIQLYNYRYQIIKQFFILRKIFNFIKITKDSITISKFV